MEKLCDVCDFQGGSQPPKNEWSFEFQVGYVRMLQIRDFTQSGKVIPEYVKISSSIKQCAEDDILIARYGASIGKILTGLAGAYNVAIMKTIPNVNKLRKKYLYYYLKSSYFQNSILNVGSRAAQAGFNKEDLSKLVIKCPELTKQDEIIEILSRLELIIEWEKQQFIKLDELIKSRFVEMFGMPGTNEKGWGASTLGKCCVINPKKGQDKRLQIGMEVSFIPMPAISENGNIDASEIRLYDNVKTGFTYFSENDVLFAKITPCMENGKGAVAVGLCNGVGFGSTEFHVIRPIEGVSNPYWLYGLTSFDTFRKDAAANMTGSAGQKRVPATFLENYKVFLPPIKFQTQFATFVHQVDKLKFYVIKTKYKKKGHTI